jgi:hypothetical protein
VTPLDRHARIDQSENPDSIEAILAAEPIENADPTEPAEPIDKTEPAEPIDRIEPAEPIDKIEPLDPMLQSEPAEPAERTDRRLFRMTAFSRRRGRQRSAGWLQEPPRAPQKAAEAAFTRLSRLVWSDRVDLLGLRALGPLAGGEVNPLVLLQAAESVSLDGGVVNENVGSAVVGGDEAVALVGVEPLHGALSHVSFSY